MAPSSGGGARHGTAQCECEIPCCRNARNPEPRTQQCEILRQRAPREAADEWIMEIVILGRCVGDLGWIRLGPTLEVVCEYAVQGQPFGNQCSNRCLIRAVVAVTTPQRRCVQHGGHLDFASLSYGDAKSCIWGGVLGSHDIGPLAYDVADQDAEQPPAMTSRLAACRALARRVGLNCLRVIGILLHSSGRFQTLARSRAWAMSQARVARGCPRRCSSTSDSLDSCS